MSILGENNNNGLLFAPTCTTCFNENKYLLMSKKMCSHQWTNECFNRTGEYIIIPSEMYHGGYYNQKSNQIFTQAQLFCAPTNNTNVLRLPRSLMKAQGKQVTQRCLDESTLSELRDDLINNWEILYNNPKYRPCKKISGGPVDRASNRQIFKAHFNQVPLLKNLVDTFESMLPYLSINLVWMLHKSKEGDGFQGWHKDFYMGG